MSKTCDRRFANIESPFLFTGYLSTGSNGTLFSTLGCYSSDIGSIVVRHTTNSTGVGGKFQLGCPTTDYSGKVFGFLRGFDSDSSNLNGAQYIKPGSTEKIYIEKFSPHVEYEISYSTLNSTYHPGTSDIGSMVGFATTQFTSTHTIPGISSGISITPAYMKLCMSNCISGASPGITASTDGAVLFRITGYSTNRRKLFVVPVFESSSFAW
jgi:hypothetical protein